MELTKHILQAGEIVRPLDGQERALDKAVCDAGLQSPFCDVDGTGIAVSDQIDRLPDPVPCCLEEVENQMYFVPSSSGVRAIVFDGLVQSDLRTADQSVNAPRRHQDA